MPSANLRETQAFFAVRAADWDARFADDDSVFAQAIREAPFRPGMTVLDLGCGTARALPLLHAAVAPGGRVVGLDATLAMLRAGQRAGRRSLLVGDAVHLPFADACMDAVFAAGLLPHLSQPLEALREAARVTRAEGALVIFHPLSRAALAARHAQASADDDVLAPPQLADLLAKSGWRITHIDDGAARFLAIAARAP
ncbi:MAG: methyltransferase domain-containing protein [Anaerolineae bacterium]|nr:methyltransferase domain-containing protein [Thermoflexales bacterium]MDW8395013.1 methyltransferase domain-containing protein [Anaerolineae bacterium]